MSTVPRGLTVLISDIRNCTSQEQEEKRVQKELANIRGKFTSGKSLDSYNKKKYAWKLVYIFMLGYEIDFGHLEIINLLSGSSFTEKQVGYLATSVLMKNTDEMMTLIVNSIRTDLNSVNEYHQSLALCAVANIGGRELTDALLGDVQRILVSQSTTNAVRKKAALCLLRLYRTNPDSIVPSEWAPNLISLLEQPNLGVVTSILGLLQTLVAKQGPAHYKAAVKPTVRLLGVLAKDRSCSPEYKYHQIPSPWLQVKLLRLLQFLPPPKPDSDLGKQLVLVLNAICSRVDSSKSTNKTNAEHSVLIEAVNLIIRYGDSSDAKLREKAVSLLGRFISAAQANIRYLGLATMSRLAHMVKREGLDSVSGLIQRHQETIMVSLKDQDISIRRRALDLLFAMCTHENSVAVVRELLQHLAQAEFGIKEEMVLKIAILAERYATDKRWYLDTIMQLITIAGDYVSEEVWHRLIQIVTNTEDLQRYAAATMYKTMLPSHVHETAVKVSAYVLGEFGYLLTEQAEEGNSDGLHIVASQELFNVIHKHFLNSSALTRRMLLHAYIKLANLYEELADEIQEVFEAYKDSLDPELQQRACEYAMLPSLNEEKLQYVLDPMPPFPEKRSSTMNQKLNIVQETESTTVLGDASFGVPGDGGPELVGADTGLAHSHYSGADSDHSSDDGGRGIDSSDEDEYQSSAGDSSHGLGFGVRGERMDDSDGDADDTSSSEEDEENKVVDLLGFDTVPKQAPASTPIPSAAPLLGSKSYLSKSAEPPIGIQANLMPQLKIWFLTSLQEPKSLLYEDNVVQIGVQHQYQGSQGKLMFFLGNKLDEELTSLMVSVVIQDNEFRVKQDPPPPTVGPRLQTKASVMLECMMPFSSPPELNISFVASTTGQKYLYQLRVPVATTTFMQPISMEGNQFKQRWEMITEPTKQSQVVFPVNGNLDQGSLPKLGKLFTSLHLGVIPAVDVNPLNLFLASTMCTGTINPQTNMKVSVGCLIQVELSPQAKSCRLTVRAMNPTVAIGTRNILEQGISATLSSTGEGN